MESYRCTCKSSFEGHDCETGKYTQYVEEGIKRFDSSVFVIESNFSIFLNTLILRVDGITRYLLTRHICAYTVFIAPASSFIQMLASENLFLLTPIAKK